MTETGLIILPQGFHVANSLVQIINSRFSDVGVQCNRRKTKITPFPPNIERMESLILLIVIVFGVCHKNRYDNQPVQTKRKTTPNNNVKEMEPLNKYTHLINSKFRRIIYVKTTIQPK